uniref:EF-hand domain-containing protein n=1 Tax=Coccolithus braarudii TaxID=221442 RepID=A0A7S0Q9T2_9EUKA
MLVLTLPLTAALRAPFPFVPRQHIPSGVATARCPSSPRLCNAGLDQDMGTNLYEQQLCAEDECEIPSEDEFTVAILGDLHIDPRKMDDYYKGREDFLPIIQDAKQRGVACAVVSLGDLGESKSVRPEETQELFAGTTECHEMAAEFLGSFGVDYEVIGGNHDLEGIDEFKTDEANLEAFLRIHKKPTPQFVREIAEKTLLVGLCSTVFRSAKYTSHEVTIDDEQVKWFEDLVKSKPAADGWKIFVFSHAPPIGSGLRVLQENHVVNGCCWLNHSGESNRKFIELVRKHRCVKGWFSGHFHLGQDYEDSITFPTIPRELGPYPNRGSCVFAQTSVMRGGTSRDGRQQSRLLRGNAEGFEICSVNHQTGAVRLDATITYTDTNHEVGVYAHEHVELQENDNFMKVYSPTEGDECYISYDEDDLSLDPMKGSCVGDEAVAWWHMSDGRVLGVYDGRLIEYDPSTLAPLGLVVGADELKGRRVLVVGSGMEECKVNTAALSNVVGMEGADCVDAEGEEQAVLLIDDETGTVTVVQPNEDGSYWRKIVRNKMIRMKEKRREQAGKAFAVEAFSTDSPSVVSSWGPYTSIVGTAKTTGVPGLTKQAVDSSILTKLAAHAFSKLPQVAAPRGRSKVWTDVGVEIKAAFESLDTDGSGVVSVSELLAAIQQIDPAADMSGALAIVKAADADGDGRVSLPEFACAALFGLEQAEKTENTQPARAR